MEKPFFSVIIPTRNRSGLFRTAIESVLSQDFDSPEIIVVNDGSTGEEVEEYKKLEANYPGVAFYYLVHRQNDHGSSCVVNFGVSRASGQYVAFLDEYIGTCGTAERYPSGLETRITPIVSRISTRLAGFLSSVGIPRCIALNSFFTR